LVAPSRATGRPGITTTDLHLKSRGFAPGAHYTRDFGGTSAATPLAAGIGALVLAVKGALTWEEVRGVMRSSAEKIDQAGGNYVDGYSQEYGYGRVNAFGAVSSASA
jgi:subtilisin family serine protease